MIDTGGDFEERYGVSVGKHVPMRHEAFPGVLAVVIC